jgi:ATP-binding cassette, subfamily C (CFTR/MRP), member 1
MSGTIRIDGLDLSTIPRQTIRSLVAALPQDPVSLTGTVRHNLDPHGAIQADEVLIQALQRTKLWDLVHARGGLDLEFGELGLSVAQQQLLCLATAILHKSRVLLLDEATSSVDRQTDEEVRALIKADMARCTVLEVAYRLDAIVGCDVAVVMEEGRIVEMGEPRELLERAESRFRSLWESQGV